MIKEIKFGVWFRDVMGVTRSVDLTGENFKGAQDYVINYKRQIELAVQSKCRGPMLICIPGGIT